MLPGSDFALTRARPRRCRFPLRVAKEPFAIWPVAAALVVLALAVSGCNLTGSPARTTHAPVLGAPSGSPPVVGQPAPAGTGSLSSVSCGSSTRCWAVGISGPNPVLDPAAASVIVASTDGGATWKAQHVTGGDVPQLSGIACPDSTRCMAVGSDGSSPGTGIVVRTLNAGARWSPATAPPNALVVTDITCAGSQQCMAVIVGATSTWSALSTDFGTSWQTGGALPASFSPAGQLTCTPEGTCLVAGSVPTGNGHGQGAVAITVDNGQTWALATVPAGTGLLRSVACPSKSTCLAAGTTSTTLSSIVASRGDMLRSLDAGHTWTASVAPPLDDVDALGCPSAQRCVMVGGRWVGLPAISVGAVATSTDAGGTFSPAQAAYAPLPLVAVDCPTASRCVAAGGDTLARITLPAPAHRQGRG